MTNPSRGDIYWIDWNPARGSEQAGRRPVIIVSTDAANLNPLFPNVIAAAISTRGRPIPTHVEVSPSAVNGLSATSYIKCEQLMMISKERLLIKVGELGQAHMASVEASLKRALSLI